MEDAPAPVSPLSAANGRLQEEYAEIESLYRTAPVGLGLLDRDLRFVRINDRLAAINGRPAAEHIGRTLREVVPEVFPTLEQILRRVLDTGQPVLDVEVRGRTGADPGVEHVWQASYHPVIGTGGAVTGVAAVVQDITTRKRAERDLLQAQNRLQAILDGMFVFVGVLSTDGRVLSANRAPLEAIGLGVDDVLNRHLADLYSIAYSGGVQERTRNAIRRAALGEVIRYDEQVLVKDGRQLWLDIMFSPLRDEQGRVVEIVGSATDVTERHQATAALAEANARLQHLSRHHLDVQETERRSLARELHDEIGQALTATRITLQALEQFPDAGATATRLHDAIAIVDRALAQVRSLSLQLRPPMLDDLGLSASMRWLVSEQAPRSGIEMSYAGNLDSDRFDPAVEIACFRIAQEALTNVVRHSRAGRAAVELRRVDDALHLRIRDDGIGFDEVEARARASSGASLGLLGMEERATLAGGGIEWIAPRGTGTEVHAWFPATPRAQP